MTQKFTALSKTIHGAVRPTIENVKPELTAGQHAVKRIQDEPVHIEATIFIDGHEQLAAEVLYRHESEKTWTSIPLVALNKRDLWNASFVPTELGRYYFTVHAWIDRFESWRGDLKKKFEADQDVSVDLVMGAGIIEKSLKKAKGSDHAAITKIIRALKSSPKTKSALNKVVKQVLAADLAKLMKKYPDQTHSARYVRELPITVDRERARFSAWYEFFPRSASGKPGQHGTFKDCEKMLPYVQSMGFDVIYFPPIHPIGTSHRKGRNNSLVAGPQDPGSPWGIGGLEGGHKSVHSQLGTLADFRRLVAKARRYGAEIALDIAYQCSPEHPYVKAHPEWFKKRADGTIQYAENPPKKYQDIYPFNFETDQWPELWDELKSVVDFWIKQGVKIFRVDNPHTKSCRFWEWMIREVKKKHPDVLFLAEAFTKPAMMYHLGKIGFSQSYTYFTWRNTKKEFKDYLDELTKTPVSEFYRPNFWPNTPDILPPHLQTGGRPAFMTRVALAATLSSSYGIYGPSYELLDYEPLRENCEEYLNSEKYEIKAWDLKSKDSIRSYIKQLNAIRNSNRSLRSNTNVNFHNIDNDHLMCFTKHTEDRSNIVLVVANLDFKNKQSGNLEIPLSLFGLSANKAFGVHDLLNRTSTKWKGTQKQLELDPRKNPVMIFRIEAKK